MKSQIIIMGIGCITILMLFALYKGINGILLTLAIGTIAAMVGVTIPRPKFLKE